MHKNFFLTHNAPTYFLTLINKKGRLKCVRMIYIQEGGSNKLLKGEVIHLLLRKRKILKLHSFDNSVVFLYTYGIDA